MVSLRKVSPRRSLVSTSSRMSVLDRRPTATLETGWGVPSVYSLHPRLQSDHPPWTKKFESRTPLSSLTRVTGVSGTLIYALSSSLSKFGGESRCHLFDETSWYVTPRTGLKDDLNFGTVSFTMKLEWTWILYPTNSTFLMCHKSMERTDSPEGGVRGFLPNIFNDCPNFHLVYPKVVMFPGTLKDWRNKILPWLRVFFTVLHSKLGNRTGSRSRRTFCSGSLQNRVRGGSEESGRDGDWGTGDRQTTWAERTSIDRYCENGVYEQPLEWIGSKIYFIAGGEKKNVTKESDREILS